MQKFFYGLLFLLTISGAIQAQNISYYPFNSQLAISSNPTNVVFLEARMQMNSATSAITTETGPMITFHKSSNALYYFGGGVNIGWASNVLNNSSILKGYYGSLGVRAFPFEKMPKFGINFEVTPYTDTKVETGLLRAWIGLSYHFGQNKFPKNQK
ncbi:MAG: hypothetical protein ACKOWQ_01115 [Aquirufa sp.]